ncbi:MAG: 3-oxoacyl-ACP synthase [Tannerella sp.]|nr:3-oxoacyl-ACP synthase [Tannerella sp.]
MIRQTGDNIISSLGFTTRENYEAVKAGRSGIVRHANRMGMREPFMASLIDSEWLDDCFAAICDREDEYTPLEKAAILSIYDAAAPTGIDLSGTRTLFLLATTKGNVHLLDGNERRPHPDAAYLWYSARRIAGFFGIRNTSPVISNACISGACAQIESLRQLETGRYDCAVVTGVDMLSKFIISGFLSFKALSSGICRPFDIAHDGLNLGEAAATIIYERTDNTTATGITLIRGDICNDANHISAPSRTGEGCFFALQSVTKDLDTNNIAFINAHGTATIYNDRMEAVAIARAGLDGIPVNGLKGCFGHTLGAAGVLESVISSHALAERIILPTQGFTTRDADSTLQIVDQTDCTEKTYFIKILSGFGGCNAALLFHSSPQETDESGTHRHFRPCIRLYEPESNTLYVHKYCRIADGCASVNGQPVFDGKEAGNGNFLTSLYRSLKTNYPKFFKMDHLSKLGFLASELIFGEDALRFTPRRDIAVICFNRSSSLDTDRAYQDIIRCDEDYFPGPSVFVYTLPNIVTAEIAIRNKIYGETSFHVCERFDATQIAVTANRVFRNENVRYALVAWVEYLGGRYETLMLLIGSVPSETVFSSEKLMELYNDKQHKKYG